MRAALPNQTFDAPEGSVTVDPATQHTWKTARVGRIRADGQFDVVWSSGKAVRPAPYPVFRRREAWDAFLTTLSQSWGGGWAPKT